MARGKIGPSNRLLPLVESIYQAATEADRWPGVLAQLCESMGAVAASIDGYDFESRRGGISHLHGVDPDWVRRYGEHYAERNLLIQRARPYLRSGVVLLASDVVSSGEFRASDYFNEFLRPIGLGDAAGACIFLERSAASQLSLFRPLGGEEFGPRDASFLRGLVPHLQRALSLHRRLEAAERREAQLEEAFERIDRALVALDGQGRPTFVNEMARRLLAPRDGLLLSKNGLRAALPADDAALRHAISAALEATSRPELGGGGAVAVRRRSARTPLAVLVVPGASQPGAELGALVFVTDPERRPSPPADRLRALFGLSLAEAKLATALAEEPALPRAAERLGVGHETARTQLKSLFRKTATRSKAELLALLARLPHPEV